MTDETRGIDAVVFDIGGVLLDWSPNYLYDDLIADPAQRAWFLTEVTTPAWNLQQDAGRPWAEAVAELTARYPEHAEWISAYDEQWLRMVGGLIDGTVALHEELRATGVPTYALTNFSAEKWEVATRTFEELRRFDGVVVSAVEQVTKPDEKLYRILIDRYDLDPARTFYTDDVQRNVDAARAVGLHAELFSDPATLRAHLTRHGLPL
ncbi:MAG TPA: HAD family phosphatase [Kribbellaceae bacterium]|nr:HAD family phosphatase [Kribbellaceae bacterium]